MNIYIVYTCDITNIDIIENTKTNIPRGEWINHKWSERPIKELINVELYNYVINYFLFWKTCWAFTI